MSDAIRLLPPSNPLSTRNISRYNSVINTLSAHVSVVELRYYWELDEVCYLSKLPSPFGIYSWADNAVWMASQFVFKAGFQADFHEVAWALTYDKNWMADLSEFLSRRGLSVSEIETLFDMINPGSNHNVQFRRASYRILHR